MPPRRLWPKQAVGARISKDVAAYKSNRGRHLALSKLRAHRINLTMSSGAALDVVDAATADYPAITKGMKNESVIEKQGPLSSTSEDILGPNGEQYPTEEEFKTLRRVYGKVNWVSRGLRISIKQETCC